jgi:hypothetical protein
MPQGNIGLRFNIDTSQARTQVEDLSRTIAGLNEQIRQATEEGDWRAVAQLTQALNDTTSARGQTMQQARQVESQQARENMREGGIFGGQTAWMFQQALSQITRGIIQSMDAALNAAKQRASGDYAGAAVSEVRASGEIAGQGVGFGVGAGVGGVLTAFTGQAWLIPLLSGLGGEIGKFIGGIEAKRLETDLAYSAQYKKAFSSIDALNQLYGTEKYTDENGRERYRDINSKSLEQNNTYGLGMYGRATAATEGTGFTTQAFIEAMKQMGGYGIRSETQALNMAQTQALWSRFTGADLSAIQKYAGQAYRYNGETNATATVYGGLMAQGMGKGQTMEFLNAMGRIMEESISKGFVRSSEEIAGNMQMLYKLSGGSALWQGEQGAQRLSQMNNAVSNATNLQRVEDVVTFGVAREIWGNQNKSGWKTGEKRAGITYSGTYADEMQLIERGVSADMLKGQFEAVNRLEGDNTAGIIERFKSMYGLNYTGATQVWAMMRNAKDANGNFNFNAREYERQIKEMQTKPGYASDSALLQTAINKMTDNLVNIGKFKFDSTEWGILENQAKNVADILAELRGERPSHISVPVRDFDPRTDPEADRPGRARDYFFTSINSDDPVFNSFKSAYGKLVEPYMADSQLFNNLMGNDNIAEFLRFTTEAMHDNKIDDFELDTMLRLFTNAVEDFRSMVRSFNSRNSTSFVLPENITVNID